MPYCVARFSAVSAIAESHQLSRSASQSESSSARRLPELEPPARAPHHVRCLAHRLGAARQHHARFAQQDLLRGLDDRLEPRAAQAVDRERRGLDSASAAEPDVAREVDRVGRGLLRVAEDDVIDQLGAESAPLDGGLAGDHAEVGGGERLERTAEGAEAGAGATQENDICSSHKC